MIFERYTMGQCTRYTADDNNSLKAVVFTEHAAKKAAEIISEEKNPDLKLRLYVKGGGCAGYQYVFDLDEQQSNTDHAVTTNGVTLLIDEISFPPLSGSIIDYIEDLEGERFTIDNPNAKKTCGCGTSFEIKEEEIP